METRNTKYAKSNDTHQILKISGDVQRIVTKNSLIYKMIKDWTKIRYGMSADFYVKVTVTQIVMDEVFREIIFPNAYIQNFKEKLNPRTGEETFEITLLQKIDKVGDIVINPFDEEFKAEEIEENTDDYVFTYISSEQKNDFLDTFTDITMGNFIYNGYVVKNYSNEVKNENIPVILKYIAEKRIYSRRGWIQELH